MSSNNSTDIMECNTSININELYQTQRVKQCNRLLYFENILKKCHHRIKTVAKKTETFCFFVVPEFSFGIPLYNVYQCAQFIIDNLMQCGFNVLYIRPNLLYISWDIRQYLTNEQVKQINNIPQMNNQNIQSNIQNIQQNLLSSQRDQYNTITNNNINNKNTNTIQQNNIPNKPQLLPTLNNNTNNTKIIRSTKEYKPTGRIIL